MAVMALMALMVVMGMTFDRRWRAVVHDALRVGDAAVTMLGAPAWAQRSEGDRRRDKAHHHKRYRPQPKAEEDHRRPIDVNRIASLSPYFAEAMESTQVASRSSGMRAERVAVP